MLLRCDEKMKSVLHSCIERKEKVTRLEVDGFGQMKSVQNTSTFEASLLIQLASSIDPLNSKSLGNAFGF